MECNDVRKGLRVQISASLTSDGGLLVAPTHLRARGPGKIGKVNGYVPGHGGDVWWVEHDDGTIGAYCFNEFEPEPLRETVRSIRATH